MIEGAKIRNVRPAAGEPADWTDNGAPWDRSNVWTEKYGLITMIPGPQGRSVQIRGELFNAFNRVYLNNPTSGNPAASITRNARNELTGGFGFINPASVAQPPRNAQLLLRVQF